MDVGREGYMEEFLEAPEQVAGRVEDANVTVSGISDNVTGQVQNLVCRCGR